MRRAWGSGLWWWYWSTRIRARRAWTLAHAYVGHGVAIVRHYAAAAAGHATCLVGRHRMSRRFVTSASFRCQCGKRWIALRHVRTRQPLDGHGAAIWMLPSGNLTCDCLVLCAWLRDAAREMGRAAVPQWQVFGYPSPPRWPRRYKPPARLPDSQPFPASSRFEGTL